MGKWLEFDGGSAFAWDLGCFLLLLSLEILPVVVFWFVGNCWVECRFCPRTRRSRSTYASRRRAALAQWPQCSQVCRSSWKVYLFWKKERRWCSMVCLLGKVQKKWCQGGDSWSPSVSSAPEPVDRSRHRVIELLSHSDYSVRRWTGRVGKSSFG